MNKNKVLIIVNSPFQALCAIEAINHYGIENPVFAHVDSPIVREKTVPLIKKMGRSIFLRPEGPGTIAFIRETKNEVKEKYSTIIIGDWFSYGQYIIALFSAKRKASFIYLDDGNSTLRMDPAISGKRYRTLSQRVEYALLGVKKRIMHINERLFSIYNMEGKAPMFWEKNNFDCLRNNGNHSQMGVYVIGTNSSALTFSDTTYEEQLLLLNKHIKKTYPDDTVWYCPHRRDTNDFSSIITSCGWKIFNTDISVEVDFIQKGINPRCVFGYNSTALLTLKKIYPSSLISTIRVKLLDDSMNLRYRNIENYFAKNEIGIMEFSS